MTLKYKNEIDQLNPDLTGFIEIEERISFRWVFEENDERNFAPVYKIDKKRLEKDTQKGKANFRGWALSFYETQEQAKNELMYWTKDKPEVFKKLGTHIAKGKVIALDGLCEEKCDERGHFDHFEYIDIDFSAKFEIVEKVAG
jgi:hypothetical protein